MHIPDGYLDISTCAVTFSAMAPVWYVSAKKLDRNLHTKQVPLLAFGAAFSFVLMMFNFPVAGGSSGHAVGGALLAILLGPWAAVSILSVVIAIQAFLFHDGGLTTFGANAFSMAFVLPFASYFIYGIFSGKNATLFRKALAGAVSGYLGLTTAALTTGIILGIQPHGINGYSPYPLNVAVPAMVMSHLLVFSLVEGIVTGLVLLWVYKNFPTGLTEMTERKNNLQPLWLGIFLLLILSPLGLLTQGTAFGEWSETELNRILGYVPFGIRKFSHLWTTPFSGYKISGHSILYGYLASAFLGAIAVASLALILGKFLAKESTETISAVKKKETHLQTIPDWLRQKEKLSAGNEKERKAPISNTLHKAGSFFSHVLCLEEFQQKDGYLQKRDPRVKLFVFALFILFSAWSKSSVLLGLFFCLAFVLGAVSGIPFVWFFQSIFLTMAFFSLIIVVPAMFQWITPGHPIITIVRPYLVITKEGAEGAGLFILRTTTAISYSAILSLTTPWTKLLKSLQIFKVPQIFLFIVEMAYRYVFLFVRLLEQIHLARNARTIAVLSLQKEQGWAAGRIAFLLRRSLELSESVYAAMTARGYEGKLKTLDRFSCNARDALFGIGSVFLFAIAVFVAAQGWLK